MKILFYDCFSGISGDMNLGAMIDIGIEKEFLVSELKKLRLHGWELKAETDQRHGIKGTKVTVLQSHHSHIHRTLPDILKMIDDSDLDDKTRDLSKNIFMKVAEAESKVHGIKLQEVHFHEVGAIDSIVDMVGAAICFNALKVDAVHISTIELGGGLVKCNHGLLPVPAPATAEILKGLPVSTGGVDFEATTPTGAAIVATLGTVFGKSRELKIEKTGYGIGQKDHPQVPNLLRVFLGEAEMKNGGHDALLIECNIDDMNPEFFEYISERLFRVGAGDVFISNVLMKKGRPGSMLSVICEPGIEDSIKNIIFTESTSLGIRTFPFRKDTLARKFEKVSTIYGEVTVKRSYYKDNEVSSKPEFEDCRRIAEKFEIPVKEVYDKIMALLVKSRK
jgi:uncharacterized protein (TIGR00299 family) protein